MKTRTLVTVFSALSVAACSSSGPKVATSASSGSAYREPSSKLTVKDVFPGLPRALRDAIGDADMVFHRSSNLSVEYRKPGEGRTQISSGGKGASVAVGGASDNPRGTFVLSAPDGRVSVEVAAAFLEAFYSELYPWHGKVEIARKVKASVIEYGAPILLGRAPGNDNEVAALWWKLRFDGSAQQPEGPLRKGDQVLIAIRTHGYKGSSFTPGDFGHSTLGLRTVGGDPANDVILNPGAKTSSTFHATMKDAVLGSPEIPNKLSTQNLWDWLESNKTKRFLDIDMRILRLSRDQARALELIRREAKHVEWGPFLMLSNNCANGALDIYDSLLPIDAEVPVKPFLGLFIVPESVLNAASQRFGQVASVNVVGDTPPPGVEKTPDITAEPLRNREESSVYRQYIAAEEAATR